MKVQHQSVLFQRQALNGFDNARNKLFSQGALGFKPYFTDTAQRQALTYPFAHFAQCMQNAVSIFYGVYLVGKLILTLSPVHTLDMILATLIQCATLLLNACNILMSLCSLGSRALATAVNGYVFESKHVRIDLADASEMGPISIASNNFFIANERVQMTAKQKEAEAQEDDNYKLAFTFV